ncbi:MAG: DDE-type integrase/transposase/recombinase, partial [Tannerellaceae bacterium]
MLDIELFRQIKEYQKLGLSKNKISKITGVYYNKVTDVFLQTEGAFIASITDNTPDCYRGYILNIIKFYPQTKDSVIWYRLGEEFPNHELKRATFYRYMKRIREESGFVNPNKRVYTSREVPKPGEEAQVDFGQFKLLNMYGHNVRVYFFCMIMSYSKMKFVYFVSEPFTTKTAIEAHDHAFKYFGGVPKTIIYDQDRVFVS